MADSDPAAVLEHAETLAQPAAPSVGPPGLSSTAPVTELDFEQRYELAGAIGEGGMGVVRLYGDKLMGRDVAMKLMRVELGKHDDARQRFVREARVQGQLEHPGIVPVHTLGTTPSGEIYFTMKRIGGESLEEVLAALAAGDERAERKYPLHRLLTAFGQLCLAIDFAHQRNVVHRDLKPANVMLGDFGEVYALDWGIAKQDVSDDDPPRGKSVGDARDTVGAGLATQAGAIVGTPGYIAPEVVALGANVADRRADVYALGAILFEVLALRPMLAGSTAQQLLLAALRGQVEPPSQRAPGPRIAPELDEICLRATQSDPEDRYASARQLHEAIDDYLAGRRDLELRREAAERHARAGAAAAERALSSATGSEQAREQAMLEVGRALALDPEHRGAMRTLLSLLTEAPRELPPQVRAELERTEGNQLRSMGRVGALGYLIIVANAPFVLASGVRSWVAFVVTTALGLMTAGLCWGAARSEAPRMWRKHLILVSGAVTMACVAASYGPFVLAPVLLAGHITAMLLGTRTGERAIYILVGCTAFFAAIALQWLGVLPPHEITADALVVRPTLFAYSPVATHLHLIACTVGAMLVPMVLVARLQRLLEHSQERAVLHAWHLRKLVPDEATAEQAPPRAA